MPCVWLSFLVPPEAGASSSVCFTLMSESSCCFRLVLRLWAEAKKSGVSALSGPAGRVYVAEAHLETSLTSVLSLVPLVLGMTLKSLPFLWMVVLGTCSASSGLRDSSLCSVNSHFASQFGHER